MEKSDSGPFEKAIRHAKATARTHGDVTDCAYPNGAWQSVWLKALQEEQQQELFKSDETNERK